MIELTPDTIQIIERTPTQSQRLVLDLNAQTITRNDEEMEPEFVTEFSKRFNGYIRAYRENKLELIGIAKTDQPQDTPQTSTPTGESHVYLDQSQFVNVKTLNEEELRQIVGGLGFTAGLAVGQIQSRAKVMGLGEKDRAGVVSEALNLSGEKKGLFFELGMLIGRGLGASKKVEAQSLPDQFEALAKQSESLHKESSELVTNLGEQINKTLVSVLGKSAAEGQQARVVSILGEIGYETASDILKGMEDKSLATELLVKMSENQDYYSGAIKIYKGDPEYFDSPELLSSLVYLKMWEAVDVVKNLGDKRDAVLGNLKEYDKDSWKTLQGLSYNWKK